MAQGVKIETEAGVGMQTPTRGLMPYFREIKRPIIPAGRGELKFAGDGGLPGPARQSCYGSETGHKRIPNKRWDRQ